MTRSVYIIGGAGVGKSTFMDALVAELGAEFAPYAPLYSGVEASTGRSRTLRGHLLDLPGEPGAGVYVGNHREWFPGTDGLDLVISPTAAEWLRAGVLPRFLVSEGAVLSTPRFQDALREETDMLLVHLIAPGSVIRQRVEERGTADRHNAEFLQRTRTRAENTLQAHTKAGGRSVTVDTSEPMCWDSALDICADWLDSY